MPIAEAMTAKVNNSLEPFFATNHKSLGSNLLPMTSMSTMNAPTLAKVMPIGLSNSVRLPLAAWIPSFCSNSANTGRRTKAKTMTRSSTTSQPTAILPLEVFKRPLSSSARKRTTVLATDRLKPNTREPNKDHPQ